VLGLGESAQAEGLRAIPLMSTRATTYTHLEQHVGLALLVLAAALHFIRAGLPHKRVQLRQFLIPHSQVLKLCRQAANRRVGGKQRCMPLFVWYGWYK
jgi:hypothetical protein